MRKRRLQLALTSFAVLMLVVQVVLAAGHLHLAGPTCETSFAARMAHDTGDTPGHPPDSEHDHCPFCWAQTAASNLLVPAPLALPLPMATGVEPFSWLSPHLTDRALPKAFQPRAPPAFPV